MRFSIPCLTISLSLALTFSACAHASNPGESAPAAEQQTPQLPKSINEQLAPSFDSVFMAVNGVPVNDLHSLLVLQNDTLIYERYGVGHSADEQHILWSATKTFTATAVGFAVQDGFLDLDTPVVNYLFPDGVPAGTSPEFSRLTLDILLKMSSGFPASDISKRIRGGENVNVIEEARQLTFKAEPGARWNYNNLDTYMCAAVVQRVTGMSLDDYLRVKLFEPIGITNWYFEKDQQGINPGAFGLHMSAPDMARMGLFLLHKGNWQGEQLLNEAWFDRACSVRIMQYAKPGTGDWNSGYGYQVWAGRLPGSFRADGMWGQYIIVVPEKQLVCVMTTLSNDRDAQMNAFWKYVYGRL